MWSSVPIFTPIHYKWSQMTFGICIFYKIFENHSLIQNFWKMLFQSNCISGHKFLIFQCVKFWKSIVSYQYRQYTVHAPLLAAASIQKMIFWPSDYHVKSKSKFFLAWKHGGWGGHLSRVANSCASMVYIKWKQKLNFSKFYKKNILNANFFQKILETNPKIIFFLLF